MCFREKKNAEITSPDKTKKDALPKQPNIKPAITDKKDSQPPKKKVTIAGLEPTKEEDEDKENNSDDETHVSKKKKTLTRSRTSFAAPLRRERTRLLRQKTQIKSKNKNGSDDKYDVEDAARVYYSDVLRAERILNNERKDSKATRPRSGERENDNEKRLPPWLRKEYVLNKKEAEKYRKITSVYGDETNKFRKNRENQFYKKLEEVSLKIKLLLFSK